MGYMNCGFGSLQSSCNITFDENIAFSGTNALNNYISFQGSSNFNGAVTLMNKEIVGLQMFSGCRNLNAPVTFLNNVYTCYQMFNGCEKLENAQINLNAGKGIRYQYYFNNYFNNTFNGCKSLKNVDINIFYNFQTGANVTFTNTFNGASNVSNINIHIYENRNYFDYFFYSIIDNNSSIENMNIIFDYFGNNIAADTYRNFAFISTFKNYTKNTLNLNIVFNNAPVGIRLDCWGLFENASNFNSRFTFPIMPDGSIIWAQEMFNNCANYDCGFTVEEGNYNYVMLYKALSNCQNFNAPVLLGGGNITSTYNVSYMLNGCKNFNTTLYIGNGVTTCNYMLSGCSNFNQPVTIPSSVTDCAFMFRLCDKFNQDVYVPDNAAYYGGILNYCNHYQRTISIPSAANSIAPFGIGLTASSNTLGAKVIVRDSGVIAEVVEYFDSYNTLRYKWEIL